MNSVCWHILSHFAPTTLSEVTFNAVRVALVFSAGWLVVAKSVGGLKEAALGGTLVFFVDHLIVTGVYMLALGGMKAFAVVLVSFVMFFWVATLIGWLGGLARKKTASLNSCEEPQ